MARKMSLAFFNNINHVVLSGIVTRDPIVEGEGDSKKWIIHLLMKDGTGSSFVVHVIFVGIWPYPHNIKGMKAVVSGRLNRNHDNTYRVIGDDIALYGITGRIKRTDGLNERQVA